MRFGRAVAISDARRHSVAAWNELLEQRLTETMTALAQDVKTDYDHHANFSQYRTYYWEKIKTSDPLWQSRIQDAVDHALQSKGWQRVDNGGNGPLVDAVRRLETDRADFGRVVDAESAAFDHCRAAHADRRVARRDDHVVAVEDMLVLHRLAAQLRRLGLAEHPANRVHDVRLAASIRPDHADPFAMRDQSVQVPQHRQGAVPIVAERHAHVAQFDHLLAAALLGFVLPAGAVVATAMNSALPALGLSPSSTAVQASLNRSIYWSSVLGLGNGPTSSSSPRNRESRSRGDPLRAPWLRLLTPPASLKRYIPNW